MSLSTEEVALVILAAIAAEQNRRAGDMRLRRTLGVLTKDLMQGHHWQELEFLQGWGLIMSEKLAVVEKHGENYFPVVTDAGRAFMEQQQDRVYRAANRGPLITKRQLYFVIFLIVVALRMGYTFWLADH